MKPQGGAGGAAASVGAEEIIEVGSDFAAVRQPQLRLHAGLVLRQAEHFHASLDRHTEGRQSARENGLGVGLLEAEDERVVGRELVETRMGEEDFPLRVNGSAMELHPGGEKVLDDAEPLEEFERARVDGGGAGLVGRLGQAVDQPNGNAGLREGQRGSKADGAGANDENGGSFHGSQAARAPSGAAIKTLPKFDTASADRQEFGARAPDRTRVRALPISKPRSPR